MPDNRRYFPQVLDRDEQGNPRLEPFEVSNALILILGAIYSLLNRVTELEQGNAQSQGLVWFNRTLSGDYNVPAPAVAVGTTVIYTFKQDGTGNHSLTWPSEFKGGVDAGQAALSYSVFMWVRESTSVFLPVAFTRGVS